MDSGSYAAAARLARAAARLGGPASPVPALTLFTDPVRTPDPVTLAARLPAGSTVLFRHFGRPDTIAQGRALSAAAQARGLVLLIAADPHLALQLGADGVHWPEARLREARRWRGRFALATASAHDPAALRRAAGQVDAVFLSPVFASRSSGAGRPLGVQRAAAMVRHAQLPVHALGGIDHQKARRLAGLGFSGIGAVDALSAD